jgi:hypothetical protein
MADPQVNEDIPSKISYFDQADVAKQAQVDFVQRSPDHEEAQAAINSAQALAHIVHPQITAEHPTTVAKELYGKPDSAVGLWEKIKNTWRGGAVTNRMNDISLLRKNGRGTPALDAEYEKLAEEQKSIGPHTKWLTEQAIGLVQQVLEATPNALAAGFGAAGAAATLSAAVDIPSAVMLSEASGGVAAVPAAAAGLINFVASTTSAFFTGAAGGMSYWTSKKFSERAAGAQYQALIDSGADPGKARASAGAVEAFTAAVTSIPVAGRLGGIVEAAAGKAVLRSVGGGIIQKAIGGAVTMGSMQAAQSTFQSLAWNWASQLKDRKDFPEIMKEAGIAGGGGALLGAVMAGGEEGIRLVRGGPFDVAATQAAQKAEEAQKAEAKPETKVTPEQNRSAYDARMAQLKELRDSLQGKISSVKDPEQRRITQQRIDDLSKQLTTPFDIGLQYFAPKPEDETLGNLFADEQVNPPEKPFELEQQVEAPTPKKGEPGVQEKFGFADMTGAEVKDEAQQKRMFEEPQMEQSYEDWIAAGEKVESPTDVPQKEFKPQDPTTFNRDYLKSLNDKHGMARLLVDMRAHGATKDISTDLERIAYSHRGEEDPVLTDAEMVRARSAVRRNIDAVKQYQAGQGDENMQRQIDYEATVPTPYEEQRQRELTKLRAKVKEQENALEVLRRQSDIERTRNTPEEQKKTGKEFAETATEAINRQEEAVAVAHRDEAIAEAAPVAAETKGPVTESEFHDVLFHDPGWERAQATIADLKDQLHAATIEHREAVGADKAAARSKVIQLRDALTSARKESAIVARLVAQDMRTKQAVREATAQARKVRDKLFSNVAKIVKGARELPDEYRGPLEAIAGRINKSMGSDPRPVEALRDIGAALGDHGLHPFSSWDKTDIDYLTDLSKKPADQWTVNDLTIAHDAINDFKIEHDMEREIKVQGEKIQKQVAAATMKGEVSKRTPEQLKARVKAMNGRPGFVDAIWKTMKLLGKEEMHYSNLVAWLSGGEDSLTHKVLAGEIDRGNSAFRDRVNRWGELHSEWFKKNGIREFDFFHAKKKVQVADDGEMRDLTAGYVISAYMHSLRDDNSASFKTGVSIESDKHFNMVKMSDGLLQKMFDEMTPQEKEYTDHLRSVIEQVSKELDDAFYARYERHPQMLDNYWHISRITETMTRIQDRKFQGIDVGNPDIFRHRTGAVTPIYWRPAENELFSLFNKAGRWIDLGEPVGHARSMLAEISLSLKEQQGDEKATNMIAKGLAAYAGKGSQPEEFEKALLKMRSLGTQSVLGGPRVTTMVKNAALGIRSIPYVGMTEWAGAAKDVLAHPKLYHDLWTERSGLYEDISRAGGSKELQDLFLASSKHPKLRKVLLAFEMAGMRAGSRIELESAHRNGLRQFKTGEISDVMRRSVESNLGKPKDENGVTREWTPEDMKKWAPEERDVQATNYAEALLKRNHMTTSPGFQANLTREGTGGLLATTLQSEKIAGVNMVISAWMDAPKTKNGYKTAVKASIIHFLAEPAIMAAIRVGWAAAVGTGAYALLHSGKKKPLDLKTMGEDEVFSDWASNVVAGGDIFFITKQAIQMAKRNTGGGGGLTLIGQYPEDFLNVAAGISAVAKAKSNQQKFNAALSLGIDSMTLIGMATGLPIKGVADTAIGAYERVKESAGGGNE